MIAATMTAPPMMIAVHLDAVGVLVVLALAETEEDEDDEAAFLIDDFDMMG